MGYSDVLTARMKELGITKQQLADLSGIPYMTVSNILKRGAEKAGVQNVFAICRALGLNPSGLVVLNSEDEMQVFKNGADMTFGQRLNFSLKKRGMTIEEVSKKTGIPQVLIQKYIDDEAFPNPEHYSTLAWSIPANIGWLMGVCNVSMNDGDENIIQYDEKMQRYTPLVESYIDAPVITRENICKLLDIAYISPNEPLPVMMREMIVYEHPAAAGLPLYAESDFERIEFPEDEVPDEADFGVRISGRSMEPAIKDKSIVWVHKQTDIYDGEIGIIMLVDSAVCKRVSLGRDGKVAALLSDNPKYTAITGADLEGLRVVGKVLL